MGDAQELLFSALLGNCCFVSLTHETSQSQELTAYRRVVKLVLVGETKLNKITALQVNLKIKSDVKRKTSVVSKRYQARTKVISHDNHLLRSEEILV